MTSCLEKCDEIARSKPARIFYGILLVIICGIGIIRLLNASNQLQTERERQSRLQLLVKPEDGLIYFNGTTENLRAWTAKLDEFLAPYRSSHPNRQKCDYDNPPAPGKVCDFDLDSLAWCSPTNNYGIKPSSACVFLKLRIEPTWTPEFLNASELPKDLPMDLRKYIEVNSKQAKPQTKAWLSCEGESSVDEENIGPISYAPERSVRLPLMIADGQDPLIAINFEKPTKGVVISVQCKLWTKNSDDSVSFQLLLD